ALSAGKHVYCEKPLAPTSADTAEMFAATRGAGVVTQVGFNYLCNPIMLLARDMIASGELGDIVGYHGIHAEEYMMDREKPWSFRFEPAGGGALADIGSHALATAEFLLGPIAKVFGDCRTIYPTRPGPDGAPREVVIDDLTNALIEFERGCCGTITANWLAAGETMSHDFKVIGSKGAITFTQERLNEMRYHSADDPAGRRGFRTIVAGPDHPPYANFCIAPGHQIGFNEMKAIEVKGFLDAIAGDINEPFGFDKGHRIQLIVDTIRASSNAKAWMPIPAAA
ncbi:MAG: Gfo/Idh/MocA family oxidoreductase, partial [Pseudomonadota bacterium]